MTSKLIKLASIMGFGCCALVVLPAHGDERTEFTLNGTLTFSSPSTKVTGPSECHLATRGVIDQDGKKIMITEAEVSGNWRCKMAKIKGLPWQVTLNDDQLQIKRVAFHVPRILVNPPSDCGPSDIVAKRLLTGVVIADRIVMSGKCELTNVRFQASPSLVRVKN